MSLSCQGLLSAVTEETNPECQARALGEACLRRGGRRWRWAAWAAFQAGALTPASRGSLGGHAPSLGTREAAAPAELNVVQCFCGHSRLCRPSTEGQCAL